MTLSEMQTALYRRLNYPDSPATAVVNRLLGFLNMRHRRLLTSSGLRQLREGFTSFTSTASEPFVSFPYGVATIKSVRDTGNRRQLGLMSIEQYRAIEPDPTTQTGTPTEWVPIGYRGCFKRPDSTGVWVASTSAADTTQTITLTSLSATTGAEVQTTSATLTGTTRLRIGTDTHKDILNPTSLSAVCAGAVTLYDAAASGNALAYIPVGRRNTRTYAIALWPTPASALAYTVDFEHAIIDLSGAADEPLLPEDFTDLLVIGALADEYQHRDDVTRYQMAEREYDRRERELKSFLYNHRAALGSPPRVEVARLGSWYPFQRP